MQKQHFFGGCQLIAVLLLIYGASLMTAFRSPSLQEVCDNETKYLGWESIEDVRKFIEQFKADPSACHKRFHNSINELEAVLQDDLLADNCGDRLYRAIRDYHRRFISYYVPEADKVELRQQYTNGLEPIPRAIHDFFIVFVNTISSICKHRLIKQLDAEIHDKNLITDDEFAMMAKMSEDAVRVMGDNYHEDSKKIDDVIIPADPLPVTEYTKLYVQVRFNDVLEKAQEVCEKKFKPVYDELFVPIIRLNNLGYWDKSESLKENLRFRWDRTITRWYSIIQICEIFRDVEIIVDTSSNSVVADLLIENESKDRRLIKQTNILSKQEADELKAQIASRKESEQSVDDLSYKAAPIYVEHKPLKFGSVLLAVTPDDRKKAVAKFEKKIKKYIRHRTNWLSLFKQRIEKTLKINYNKFKIHMKNKDEDSALGKLTKFVSVHKLLLGSGSAVLATLVTALLK